MPLVVQHITLFAAKTLKYCTLYRCKHSTSITSSPTPFLLHTLHWNSFTLIPRLSHGYQDCLTTTDCHNLTIGSMKHRFCQILKQSSRSGIHNRLKISSLSHGLTLLYWFSNEYRFFFIGSPPHHCRIYYQTSTKCSQSAYHHIIIITISSLPHCLTAAKCQNFKVGSPPHYFCSNCLTKFLIRSHCLTATDWQ